MNRSTTDPRRPVVAVSSVLLALVALTAATPAGAKPLPRTPVSTFAVQAARPLDAKMDAGLRLIVDQVRAMGGVVTSAEAATRLAPFLDPALPFHLLPPTDGEHQALVFLRLDSDRAAPALEAHGAQQLRRQGSLVLARIPVSRIEEVSALPEVRAMSLSKRWFAALDSSRIRSGVLDVHSGAGTLPQAYEGDGVIVGVLDSGIDYTHADFRTAPGTAPGTSRLKGLFDFSQGTGGAPCRVGQLDSLTCPEIDGSGGHGHGTHVTGIASGNGRLHPQYVGMAPHADLLFVKGIRDAQSNGGFADADVVNGVAWMLDQAAALGKPIAVNLSLGSQLGAHDGTSVQEQFLDAFAGPGRIIVAAAGNSGGDPIHVSYAVQGTDYDTALESWLNMTGTQALLDLWAPAGSSIKVGLAAYDPQDIAAGPIALVNPAAPGQLVQGTLTFGSTNLANITIDARTTADANNGDRNCLIAIQPAPGGFDPRDVLWSVYTFGTGTFDLWAAVGGNFPDLPPPAPGFVRQGDDAKTVGIPATAKRLLCVGSHVTKTQWVNVNGQTVSIPSAVLDSVSIFSSRGPSRDGRILPNLTAPGEAIISALSKDFPSDVNHIVQGGGYQEQQGTSQASPHITGIVALMLQRDPALTPENARQILQDHVIPAGGPVPNNTYGSGRVQALAALEATPDPLQCVTPLPNGLTVPCDQLAEQPLSLMAYPNPSPGTLRFSFIAPTGMRAHLALYDIMGRRMRTLIDGDVAPGVRSEGWSGDDDAGRPLPSGLYFARLITPRGPRTVRFMLTR